MGEMRMKCPYCGVRTPVVSQASIQRPSTSSCSSCARTILEHQPYTHHLFHTRSQDTPLQLVLSDLPTPPLNSSALDPFSPTGFVTAFSAFSLEPAPLFLRSNVSFSGQLAQLERVLDGSGSAGGSSNVVVDGLRAYMQIVDVSSILGLDCDIADHAFGLFRDCCNATCLRNRSVEALATAALVQAIREAQEPRTLQEISIAANVPQKEIGKYIKILGEALQLSQPINSNSISVHMPRFCTLLQLNKSAQELATHIGEVVINKCFCTRRNPISISAAAIYLACQLEDKRKTQAEICKVTGLTEVTLRKVYKELLENWDDLLPPNYTPAVPPEKAFPTTAISSGRSLTPRGETPEITPFDRDRQPELKPNQVNDVPEASRQTKIKENTENKSNPLGPLTNVLTRPATPWQSQVPLGPSGTRTSTAKDQVVTQADTGTLANNQELEEKITKEINSAADSVKPNPPASTSSATWPFWPPSSSAPSGIQFSQGTKIAPGYTVLRGSGSHDTSKNTNQSGDT